MSSFFRLAGVSVVCILLSAGCVIRARPAYVVASYEPDDPDRYPHTVYEGRRVYYIDGRWYTRDGPRWIYYREEPPPLYQFRASVRSAPPAYRERRHERRQYRREARREPRRRDAPSADERRR